MTIYKVGQIIYTILEDKRIILPVQIVEQVVIKNLTGEETNYKVLLPNKKSQKVSIERLDKIFNSIDEASNYLLENAKSAIESMTKDAFCLEKEFFHNSLKTKEVLHVEDKVEEKEKNKLKVSLPDGQVANISISNISDHIVNNDMLEENYKEEDQKKT
mgnify:CR=1 FL=1|tara:strand:- start:1588 stop:2064 length:477 start_codon:yes stop_codon:yes gene_type:complete